MASSAIGMGVGGVVGALVGLGVAKAVDKFGGVAAGAPADAAGAADVATDAPADAPADALADAPADADAPAPLPAIAPPTGKEATHAVFETKTRYLTTSNEFYIPLDRFHMYLMFAEEKEAFAATVAAIDDLVGLEELITARNPVMLTAIPTMGQRARNEAKRLMTAIIEFNQSQRPSQIKRGKMESLRDDLVKIMDEIVGQMHRTLATRPGAAAGVPAG